MKHLYSRLPNPWLCCGDFNEILRSGEKQGSRPKSLQLMQEFRTTLLCCGLVDLGFQGNQYTWNNGCPKDAFVRERLDRACASAEWRELFPHVKVSHLQASYSDHIPILINIIGLDQWGRRKKIPQRFEEKWASHAECENVIRQA